MTRNDRWEDDGGTIRHWLDEETTVPKPPWEAPKKKQTTVPKPPWETRKQTPKKKQTTSSLPKGSGARKAVPLARGLLDYFPAALAAVAAVSNAGNDKHNPGEELHHARGKSMDHADCILRHLVDRGDIDLEDGLRHSAKTAWRALALLQEELEAAGEAPLARGAREAS